MRPGFPLSGMLNPDRRRAVLGLEMASLERKVDQAAGPQTRPRRPQEKACHHSASVYGAGRRQAREPGLDYVPFSAEITARFADPCVQMLPLLRLGPLAGVSKGRGHLVGFGRARRARVDDGRVKGLNAAPRMAGIAQLAERQVVVLDVTGSSPVARPIPLTPRSALPHSVNAADTRRCGQPGAEASHRLVDVLERKSPASSNTNCGSLTDRTTA